MVPNEQPICDTEDVTVPIENWESWKEIDIKKIDML